MLDDKLEWYIKNTVSLLKDNLPANDPKSIEKIY